jgi:hypothetical protein
MKRTTSHFNEKEHTLLTHAPIECIRFEQIQSTWGKSSNATTKNIIAIPALFFPSNKQRTDRQITQGYETKTNDGIAYNWSLGHCGVGQSKPEK